MKNLIAGSIFLLLPIFMFSCTSTKQEEHQQGPNLLIIHTDEHNFRTLGCYRNLLSEEQAYVWGEGLQVETPNIDWLADNGVLFAKCYANTPVCGPSRASFVTGMYPHHTGVPINDVPMYDEMVTFAEILQKEGYHTGYLGKWHLDGEGKPQWEPDRKFGFTDNRYMYNRGHWKKLEDTPDGPRVASVNENGVPNYNLNGADETSYTTDFLTDRTIEMILENKEGPFCIMLSLPDPHGPDRIRAPYDEMYAGLPYTAPATYNKPDEGVPSWAAKQNNAGINQSNYFGMVKCIDDNVGKLIEALRNEGLLNNTIIVFTADHGDLRGEHHRHNKGVPLEASAKIPLIFYYPEKLDSGVVISGAVSTVDFTPTILGLMNVSSGYQKHGKDLSQEILVGGKQDDVANLAFLRSTGVKNDGKWVGVCNNRYKLILSAEDAPWLLDLEKDPNELINYIDSSEYSSVGMELAEALQEYGEEFSDPYLENTKMSTDLEALLNK